MNVLNFKNVSIVRDGNTILDNISLSIAAHQNTAIIGPNGAGKTSLLKIITRQFYPHPAPASFVELFGQQRWNVWDLRRRLGVVSLDLQQETLSHTTGRSVVLTGFYSSLGRFSHQTFSPQQGARADQLLVELGVAELADRPFAKMSTGEQRRCLLARALVHDPEVLVLDEPTTGLDLQATFYLIDTMRRLIEAGKTVVLVTHHIHEIPPEVDNVVLLKNGRIVAQGPKLEILTDRNISQLFETPAKVISDNGFFQVVPGSK